MIIFPSTANRVPVQIKTQQATQGQSKLTQQEDAVRLHGALLPPYEGDQGLAEDTSSQAQVIGRDSLFILTP